MDRFETMRVFTRVVERRSFTAAAADLGLPRSTVTDAVKQIEARLGVQLLERTTRVVRPTLDGEAYHQRCLSLIADLEDAESAFCGAKPKGPLRIDMNGTLARNFVLPHLTDFLAEYPDIQLYLSEGDRLVDLIREGIDCVVRVGELRDSDMIARRLTMLNEVTCAAPSYLESHGMPGSIDALKGHCMVGYHSSATGGVLPLEFQDGGTLRHVTLPMAVTVNSADNYAAMTKLGFGLAQVPRYRVAGELAEGALVEVLPQNPPTPSPVSLLCPRNRQLSPRVRVFMDWLTQRFARDRI
jgi:DNA-binding transcriptional LysR family regulator